VQTTYIVSIQDLTTPARPDLFVVEGHDNLAKVLTDYRGKTNIDINVETTAIMGTIGNVELGVYMIEYNDADGNGWKRLFYYHAYEAFDKARMLCNKEDVYVDSVSRVPAYY
jgi:hypothetical protein